MKSTRLFKKTILLVASLGFPIFFLFGLTATTFLDSNVPAPMSGSKTGLFSDTNTAPWLAGFPFEGFLNGLWANKTSTLSFTRIPLEQSHSAIFREFAERVMNGNPDQVRGVFVDGLMALPVVQQPLNQATYVATQMDMVTQFQSAADHGVIGLLAHNYLSGSLFYQLIKGEEVRIVFGDGSYQDYRVSGSYAFQKLKPNSLQSELVDMSTEELLTTNQVFNRFYNGGHHLTFQTCLEEGGVSNWGLTFVVAEPLY